MECAQAALAVNNRLQKGGMALYIGVPFCPTRCAYCSFVSADVGRTLKLVEPYVEGLLREVAETGRVLREAGAFQVVAATLCRTQAKGHESA